MVAKANPRPEWWPEVDRLLDKQEARQLVGVPDTLWNQYVNRYEVLCRGERVVDTDGKRKRGRRRWLLSSVLRHIHEELPGGAA